MAGAHLLAPPPPPPSALPSGSSTARSCRSSRFRFSPPASPLAVVRRRPDLDGRAHPQGQAGAVLQQSGLLGVDAVCIHLEHLFALGSHHVVVIVVAYIQPILCRRLRDMRAGSELKALLLFNGLRNLFK
uniref:Uncharacterized protein n=1 Tax=Aegilops tauschii TaxID=37682 RepID=M8BC16_AEGTA